MISEYPMLRTLATFSCSLAVTLALGACVATGDPSLDSTPQVSGDPGKLLIVDCLLPGQVRRLGTSATYISARRPIKTTISLCEIRGGEYIAYDRADLNTALRFWQASADSGDPAAQTNVGEIYERGLGVAPDYTQAAIWYRKAAEQNYARAQSSLGHLYEKGLGVPQDRTQALNWYRKSTGLSADELVFTSSLQELRSQALAADQAVSSARQEAASARREAAQLRERVSELQTQLRQQNRQEQSIRQKLNKARQDLLRTPVRTVRAEPRVVEKVVIKEVPGKVVVKEVPVEKVVIKEVPVEKVVIKEVPEKVVVKEVEKVVVKEVPKEVIKEVEVVRKVPQQVVKVVPIVDDQEVRKLKAQLAQQIEEQSRIQKEAELLEQRLQAEARGKDDLNAQLNQLEQELTRSKTEKQQLAQSDQSLKQQQLQQLAQAQKDLQTARQALQDHNQLLQSQDKAEAEQLQQALSASGQRISELEQTLQQSREQQAEQADLDVQRVNLKLAREQLEATQQEIERQRQQLEQQDSEEIAQLNQKLQQQSGDLKKKEKEIQQLSQKLDNSAEKLAQTEGQIKALEEAKEQLLRSPKPAAPEPEPEKERFAELDFGRYHALVIGNNSYASMESLKTAVGDARAIANVLRSRYNFKVRLLVNATRSDILSALNSFREKLGKNDNFLLYYAGHGELDRSNDRGHWLPVDADPGDTTNWISNTSVTDILNAMNAKHVMVIADSCYSGSLTRSVSTSMGGDVPPAMQEKWLRKMITLRSRTVLTSGGLQPVLDSGAGSHSVFANVLLRALRNNKDVLEGPVLFSKVARRVKSAAGKLGYDQTPEYAPISFAGDLGAPFFFRPGGGST